MFKLIVKVQIILDKWIINGRFILEIKIYGIVEILISENFNLATNVTTSSRIISAIYFDPSGVM
jgi:hypothetical protein